MFVPWSNGSAQGTIVNCTIAYNNSHGVADSDPSAIGIINSILFFNSSGGTQIRGAGVTASYSDIQGGFSGVGNLNCNPSFWSASQLMIVDGSCCMDAGLNISGLPGRNYELRYTTDLNNTNFATWPILGTNTTPWFYIDTNSCGSLKRFYGVKMLP